MTRALLRLVPRGLLMRQETYPAAGPVDPKTGMRYAPFVERTSGEGSRAWEIHDRAQQLKDAGRDIIFLSIGTAGGRSKGVAASPVALPAGTASVESAGSRNCPLC